MTSETPPKSDKAAAGRRGRALLAKFGIKDDATVVPVPLHEPMSAVDGASVVAVAEMRELPLESNPAMVEMAAAMAGAPPEETPNVKRTTYNNDDVKL